MKIKIRSLIYTRLRGQYAKTPAGGFQIAFQSTGLTAEQAREIEGRVKCCTFSGDAASERLQFFAVSGDAFVCVRTIAVSDPEIVDRSRSAFLAHAVVLSAAEFRRLQCNPFAILDGYQDFVGDAPELVDRYLSKPSIDTEVVDIPAWTAEAGGDAEAEELQILKKLAIAAADLMDARRTIRLREDADAAADTIRALFTMITEPRLRERLLFCTQVGRCIVNPGDYWLVADMPVTRNGFLLPDAGAEFQQSRANAGQPPKTRYRLWREFAEQNREPQVVVALEGVASRLAAALDSSDPAVHAVAMRDSDGRVAEDFLEVFGDELRERFLLQVRKFVSSGIADLVIRHFFENTEAQQILEMICAPADALRTEQIGLLCVTKLEQQLLDTKLTRADWKSVCKLTSDRRQTFLWWYARLRSLSLPIRVLMKNSIRRSLSELPTGEFSKAIPLMPKRLDPVLCCVLPHLSTLFSELSFDELSDSVFVKLVFGAAELQDELPEMAKVESRISAMSARYLKKARGMCEKRKVPNAIADKIQESLESTGSVGFFSFFMC